MSPFIPREEERPEHARLIARGIPEPLAGFRSRLAASARVTGQVAEEGQGLSPDTRAHLHKAYCSELGRLDAVLAQAWPETQR